MATNQELQTWEEFKLLINTDNYLPARTQVNVACPECGRLLWRRNDVILTTYPAQYQYECDCGWVGTAWN